jgi:hypothetical protein
VEAIVLLTLLKQFLNASFDKQSQHTDIIDVFGE